VTEKLKLAVLARVAAIIGPTNGSKDSGKNGTLERNGVAVMEALGIKAVLEADEDSPFYARGAALLKEQVLLVELEKRARDELRAAVQAALAAEAAPAAAAAAADSLSHVHQTSADQDADGARNPCGVLQSSFVAIDPTRSTSRPQPWSAPPTRVRFRSCAIRRSRSRAPPSTASLTQSWAGRTA
jgi:hypothetical protein